MFRPLLLAALLLVCPAAPAAAQGRRGDDLARLLRYPDVSHDKIAFVYASDIWVVEAGGGLARRLTSGPGEELFPKFSPDGRSIAFIRNGDIYVVRRDGRLRRRIVDEPGPGPGGRGGTLAAFIDWQARR